MSVEPGCADIAVSEQFLYGADIISILQRMCRKGVQKYFETGSTSGIQPAHEKKYVIIKR